MKLYICRKESLWSKIETEIQDIIKEAREIIDEIRNQCLDKSPNKANRRAFIKSIQQNKTKFYIDNFHEHFHKRPFADMGRRYSLIPCVFELLQFTKEEPAYSKKSNYYFLGKSADDKMFKVVVRKEKTGYVLLTFFPVDK